MANSRCAAVVSRVVRAWDRAWRRDVRCSRGKPRGAATIFSVSRHACRRDLTAARNELAKRYPEVEFLLAEPPGDIPKWSNRFGSSGGATKRHSPPRHQDHTKKHQEETILTLDSPCDLCVFNGDYFFTNRSDPATRTSPSTYARNARRPSRRASSVGVANCSTASAVSPPPTTVITPLSAIAFAMPSVPARRLASRTSHRPFQITVADVRSVGEVRAIWGRCPRPRTAGIGPSNTFVAFGHRISHR